TVCYPGAAAALSHVADRALAQGLLADGQCFTRAQLRHGLTAQDANANLDELLHEDLCVLSCEVRARKPSERLFRQALSQLAEQGIAPDQVLHVGSRLLTDLAPARRLGMRTALFAGDRTSLQADQKQLNEPATRPDILLTEVSQIAEVVG